MNTKKIEERLKKASEEQDERGEAHQLVEIHAPTDIKDLLAEVDRLEKELERSLLLPEKKDELPRYLRICPKCQHNEYMAVTDKICERCKALGDKP